MRGSPPSSRLRAARSACGPTEENAIFAIVAPSGRGRGERLTATGAYVAGDFAGAVALATAAFLIQWATRFDFPRLALGLVAAVCVFLPSRVHWVSISRWRVPRTWGARGRSWFALMFGFALGTGFLTATPSVGFFVLVCWLLSASTASGLLIVTAFALARAIAPVAIATDSRGLTERSRAADGFAELSEALAPIERLALLAIAMVALATAA